MHCARRFTFDRLVGADRDGDLAAAHALDRGLVLAAGSIEQRERIAGLHSQHLHVACGAGRQRQAGAGGQRHGTVKTRHAMK
jgi:hypothetical protein